MKKIEVKKILVHIDFSESSVLATSRAITLATLLKADILFIHVIEFNGYNFSIVPETQTILPSLQELEKSVEKKTDEIQKKIKKIISERERIYNSLNKLSLLTVYPSEANFLFIKINYRL